MTELHYSIAKNFSKHPGPRFKSQGANSGEAFRKKLVELLDSGYSVVMIDLDGTKGMGSSFLDEAFGGLIRSERKSKDDVRNKFKFVSYVDPSYIESILDAIDRAEPEEVKH